jgi:hypothetical protein
VSLRSSVPALSSLMESSNSYGYQSNTRVKFVLVLALADAVVRDIDVKTVRAPRLRLAEA